MRGPFFASDCSFLAESLVFEFAEKEWVAAKTLATCAAQDGNSCGASGLHQVPGSPEDASRQKNGA